MMRKMDYYLKGMNLLKKQEFYRLIDNLGPNEIERIVNKGLLEKLKEDARKLFEERKWFQFSVANDFLIANERNPIFTDPKNIKQSSIEYIDAMTYYKDDKPIEDFFGCTFENYIPKAYKRVNLATEKEKEKE